MSSPVASAFSNWYGEECCEWEGVECDATRTRIHSICFHCLREKSDGEVEPWYPNATLFGQFEELQELELPGNHIGGFVSIHAFRELKQLQKLDLHDNSIHNGSNLCWSNSPSLYFLDLSSNNLHGNIPDCLCHNLVLKELILFDSDLFGSINLRLGKMVSLQHLDLSDNHFNGSFHSLPISNLTNIESLVLSRNEFHGIISLCIFANLSRLSELGISFNHMVVESERDSPSYRPYFSLNTLRLCGCNLKNNTELWLRGNNFTGPFTKNISSRLTLVDISDIFLHGKLPIDFSLKFSQLGHLKLSKNSFNGVMTYLSRNGLSGDIPDCIDNITSWTDSSYGGYLQTASWNAIDITPHIYSARYVSYSKGIDVSSNKLSGQIPIQMTQLTEILWLNMSNNLLIGQIPSSLGNLRGVESLDLSHNLLIGQIPSSMGNLRVVESLDLSHNNLSGWAKHLKQVQLQRFLKMQQRLKNWNTPSLESHKVLLLCIDCQGCLEVERAALLQIKDSMSSPVASAFSNWYGEECCEWEGVECDATRTRIHSIFFHYWRGQRDNEVELWYPNATLFAQFEELQELELPGNHIGGFVSVHAFRTLKCLQKLDLRDNSIRNGSSLCWGKSPSLYYLDVSDNKLEGNIPDCLPDNLFLLQHLDLSYNQFNGSFPSLLISNLKNIESLFLSSNEFQGRYRPEFSTAAPFRSFQQQFQWQSATVLGEPTSDAGLIGQSVPRRNAPRYDKQYELSDIFGVIRKQPDRSFPKLKELHLGGNRFKGRIPLQICQMRELHIFRSIKKWSFW
ncbi:receptor-like protein 15 [Hibiscus syriacus]|uniref:receptor-like protein 15 n=1 Tax=Hibiscus syriacus TaxID=106335 RepID=UPI001924D04E|nr:receptor-like protein 15 [Hibiscus syriacus]